MGKSLSVIDTVFVGILLAIFGLIVLHAPISVGLSTLWPDYSLVIKSWKEILLAVAFILGVVILTTKKQWSVLKSPLFYAIFAFAGLNILLIPLYFTGFEATMAGLFINLRFLVFFGLVSVAIKLYPQLYKAFLVTFVAGALVVVGFAILQVTVLPHDVLKYIGYNESTIMPYLTVDQNYDYIRINSTLRGPNPLGAYAAIVLVFVLAAWLQRMKRPTKQQSILLGILGAGAAIALWASYARSAALAAIVAVAVVLVGVYGRRIPRALWVSMAIVGLLVIGSVAVFKDTQFVSQVILHEDPEEGNNVNSNDGHIESLADGTYRMLTQPLGAGIGSTGSASLLTDEPVIIENQYLFIAHETGWIGLGLFLIITYLVLIQLWRRRAHWLALGVCASGVGLALAGMVLPIWVDDTVSMIWWGLAAIALALPVAHKTRASKKGKKA